MHLYSTLVFLSALATVYSTSVRRAEKGFNLRPFRINLVKEFSRLQDLTRATILPGESEYPGLGDSAGIDLDVLKSLRRQWFTAFDWKKEQRYMNSFKHYTATVEDLTTHFIHERSSDSDAIPLILGHGWPGSFLEFAPIIKNLTKHAKTTTGK